MLDVAFLCIATAVYFEARSEPPVGQSAVAHVILNRVADPRYPDTACEVVTQGPTYKWTLNFPVRHKCQFSFFCDGKSDQPDKDSLAWQSAVTMTYGALTGRTYDPTDGATHYHATYVNPSWASSKTKTVQINDHVFYRWEQ